jgi:hypothetical protein
MNDLTRICSVLFLWALFAVTAAPQQPAANKGEEELRRQRERLQAVSMIEQTASEAPLWNDKKNAVRALADAADLLWDEKPGQGAKWLIRAWELIEQVSDAPQDERLKDFFSRSDRTDLRTAVLTVARNHDRALAEKFLKQLAEQEPNEKKNRGAFDNRTARSEQLLQMAQQTIESDPELAFSLAERSLVDGISFGLQNILTSLRKKNAELANRLFDLAIARFNAGQPDASEAQVLAGYLFQSGFTFGVNSRGQTVLAVNPLQQNSPPVALSEPQRAKAFLVAVFEKLISNPWAVETPEGRQRAQPIVTLGERLSGPYRTYAPDLAASALGLVAQLKRQLFPELDSGATTQSRTGSGDSSKPLTREELNEKRITDLEDKAERESNSAFRNVAYAQAALAVKPEDFARAKSIAEKIDDDALRSDAISFVLYRAALSLIDKSEPDKVIEIASQISDAARRAVARIAIANRLLAKKTEPEDRALLEQRALDLLNEVERDLTKQEPSTKVARILLGRTAVLAKLDKEQALTALQHTAQVINKLEAFDLRDGAAPDLALGVSASSGATVDRPRIGFSFRNAIEPLITTNFEQIASAADAFTSKEVRGVARLEVAKIYLRQRAN